MDQQAYTEWARRAGGALIRDNPIINNHLNSIFIIELLFNCVYFADIHGEF